MSLAVCAAFVACASDQIIPVKTNPTNAALAVSVTAKDFTGYIGQISVTTDAGVTANVSVAVSAYRETPLVLASNTVTGFKVWRPRLMECALTGSDSLVVTNVVDGDEFIMAGEVLTVTASAASKTGSIINVRVKYEK
jgi:hypothetical protein